MQMMVRMMSLYIIYIFMLKIYRTSQKLWSIPQRFVICMLVTFSLSNSTIETIPSKSWTCGRRMVSRKHYSRVRKWRSSRAFMIMIVDLVVVCCCCRFCVFCPKRALTSFSRWSRCLISVAFLLGKTYSQTQLSSRFLVGFSFGQAVTRSKRTGLKSASQKVFLSETFW